MKYINKFLLILCFMLLAIYSAEATTFTLRTLTAGTTIATGDLFESRQGADTSDKSVTSDQIKTWVLTTPTISTTATFAAGSSITAKTSTSATDINPPFDTRILGNPVAKVASGTCTTASVNADTCVILAGVASRTITVTNFDVVATGAAATCTGVLLEDTNGTPVVVATLAAATLTSGAHNVPLAATLGAGFGAGAGLTVAKGLQLDVNGSGCTTVTAFKYTVSYTVQ